MKMKTFFIASLLGLVALTGSAEARVHFGIDFIGAFFAPPPPPIVERVVVVERPPCHCERCIYYARHPRHARACRPHVVREEIVVEECPPPREESHVSVDVRVRR